MTGIVYRNVIAIDGYSSCGKSTVARALAKRVGYVYFDSGAMYRAVTLYCLQNGIIRNSQYAEADVVKALGSIEMHFELNPLTGDSEIVLNGKNVEKEIRGMEVASMVSHISTIAAVREKLATLQRSLGASGKGIVMDGRDIGTNVFPDAFLKLFMTASKEVRTIRRWEELKAKGMDVSKEEVQKNLEERDHEDTHRKHSPLRQAADAVVLDNSNMNREQQLEFAVGLFNKRKISSPL